MQQVLGQWNYLMKDMVDARGSGGHLASALEKKHFWGY